MFKRMTVWAKDFEVRKLVVEPIPVFMVNAKNAWFIIVAAAFAFFEHVSGEHSLSDSGKGWGKSFLFAFVDARAAAKLPIFGRAGFKFRAAMSALHRDATSASQGFVVARSGAILCLVRPRRNVRKVLSAHRARGVHFGSGREGKASPRAVFCGFNPMFGNVKCCATMLANYVHGGSYALG